MSRPLRAVPTPRPMTLPRRLFGWVVGGALVLALVLFVLLVLGLLAAGVAWAWGSVL